MLLVGIGNCLQHKHQEACSQGRDESGESRAGRWRLQPGGTRVVKGLGWAYPSHFTDGQTEVREGKLGRGQAHGGATPSLGPGGFRASLEGIWEAGVVCPGCKILGDSGEQRCQRPSKDLILLEFAGPARSVLGEASGCIHTHMHT